MATWTDIITEAFLEIRVARAGDVLSSDLFARGLRVANSIIDQWNAERLRVYADMFVTNTLTPSLQTHTIGPSGTWTQTSRPVSIEGASVLLGGTDNPKTPIVIRDAQWWNDQTVPSVTAAFPTDLYYQPDWPNGSIVFWPIPTTAYQVELWVRMLLSAVTNPTADFSLPPGYQRAIELTLAEALAPGQGQTFSEEQKTAARDAREIAFGNNVVIPNLRTLDAGMPGSRGGGYLYRTGGFKS
jgi:hypothetical protein